MDDAQLKVLDELDDQLAEALRRAANRAEHMRLERIRATAAKLRSCVNVGETVHVSSANGALYINGQAAS